MIDGKEKMISIRRNVFETNSSSTHSIAISKEPVKNFPASIYFGLGEYGWEFEAVDDTASYLYTAICNLNMMDCLDKIKAILDGHNIQYTFAKPKRTKHGLDYNINIDHCEELADFIDEICNDEDKLLRYLFGDSAIYTGNDNSGEYTDMCYCAEEKVWEDGDEGYREIPNPNHHSEKYDYYFKGN